MSSSLEKTIKRFTGTVPEDMVTNILLRLDEKTLVGLKSVSKPWLALISSPHFAKSHLAITAAAAEEKDQEIHIVHTYDSRPGIRDSISLINLGTRQLITRLNFPLRKCWFTIVGSACGIVCIKATKFGSDDEYLYLWNPATNLYKLVPSPPSMDYSETYFVGELGFGFDEIDNDFKIVRVLWRVRSSKMEEYNITYPHDCEEVYVNVYSSKKNAWQKVEQEAKAIDDIYYNNSGPYVSVNGGLLCYEGCYGIITFDLHTEVLNSPALNYPVPTFEAKINNFNVYDACAQITNFNDSIAVIIYKQIGFNCSNRRIPIYEHKDYKLNLWALDDKACLRDGGIQASWTLIYNVDLKLPLGHVHGYLNIDHLLLLLYDNDWCLYNPDKKEPRYFIHKFRSGEVFKYTKSLFTIPGFKQINSNAPFPEADE